MANERLPREMFTRRDRLRDTACELRARVDIERAEHLAQVVVDLLGLMIHDIGVSWPHHIFVNKDFEVLGAD